ncbi:hypothetical protein BX600DRAFT_523922 [Xylariales sp. PMI_506]|nr:hypothetical protein BX600DRAFT_523922 [Xylariales sp. PMI_506]
MPAYYNELRLWNSNLEIPRIVEISVMIFPHADGNIHNPKQPFFFILLTSHGNLKWMHQKIQIHGREILNLSLDNNAPSSASDIIALSKTSSNSPRKSPQPPDDYDIPESYRNLDDAVGDGPVQNPDDGSIFRSFSRENRYAADEKQDEKQSISEDHQSSRRSEVSEESYYKRGNFSVINSYRCLRQHRRIVSSRPRQNPHESMFYRHHSLEESRSRDQRFLEEQEAKEEEDRETHTPAKPGPGGLMGLPTPLSSEDEAEKDHAPPDRTRVSRLATEVYTVSYLVFFSLLGTLARLGLQALASSYPGTPLLFAFIWPNFAGYFIMGFLAEVSMIFRHDRWGAPTAYHQQQQQQEVMDTIESDAEHRDPEAKRDRLEEERKEYMVTKKTIPLYIRLSTRCYGSFTSFSSFIRDVFLAVSNDLTATGASGIAMVAPARNGGFSVMALLAIILATITLSLGGLMSGAHCAIALWPFLPALPYSLTRKVLDRLCVLLAWLCWLGAVLLSVFPPDRFSHPGASETWRGRATFALVFAPFGCLARFALSLYLNGRVASFPLGTFTVNMLGTAVLGTA